MSENVDHEQVWEKITETGQPWNYRQPNVRTWLSMYVIARSRKLLLGCKVLLQRYRGKAILEPVMCPGIYSGMANSCFSIMVNYDKLFVGTEIYT